MGDFMQNYDYTTDLICNTFTVQQHPFVDTEKNQRILGSYDYDHENVLRFSEDTDKHLCLLKSAKLCQYQARLFRAYFTEPESHLSVDCDRLTFTIICTERDVQAAIKKVGTAAVHRFTKVAKENTQLKITPASTYEINKDWKITSLNKTKKARPYYSHAFKMEIDACAQKSVFFFVSDGKKRDNGKLSLRVDFTPQYLNDDDFKLVLGHFHTKFGKHRFCQLIKKARLTRIDFGVNLYGLSGLFFNAYRDVKKPIDSHTKPSNSVVAETVYLNSKRKSSYCIIYEKILKEANNYNIDKTVWCNFAVTTRMEYRHYPYRSGKTRLLSELDGIAPELSSIRVASPGHFHLLPEDMLLRSLMYKKQSDIKLTVRKARRYLWKMKKKLTFFQLDKAWVQREQDKLAQKYMRLLLGSDNL